MFKFYGITFKCTLKMPDNIYHEHGHYYPINDLLTFGELTQLEIAGKVIIEVEYPQKSSGKKLKAAVISPNR